MKIRKQRGVPYRPDAHPEPDDGRAHTSGLVAAQERPTARYDGVQVTVAGPAGQGGVHSELGQPVGARYRRRSQYQPIPFSDIDSKVLAATGTNTFLADVYYIGSQTAGQLMASGQVVEVPEASAIASVWTRFPISTTNISSAGTTSSTASPGTGTC